VIIVVFENKESPSIVGSRDAPTFNAYARRYASLTRYYAVTHPSLPNYLALISGSTHNITNDCTDCVVKGASLADTLEAAGRSWKTYAEALPEPGFLGAESGRYAKKHNPLVYFNNVINSPARRARIVPLTQLRLDLAAQRLPDFSLVVPDMCNSMHDCPVSVGDAWLARTIPALLGLRRTVIFVLFDEGRSKLRGGGHTAALSLGRAVRAHVRFKAITGHYGVLHENVLIVSGMLVGASGTLLTILMGRAMNRSLANVLFGAFGQIVAGPTAAADTDGAGVRSATADDVAMMLAYAKKVVIVPGYGLAVAQAQHDVRNLADLLEARGVEVSYAIHPVAGRMPGHMNVLLAEANVPYPQLKEMDDANPEFPRTDVALVIGANDVVNPDARNNAGSPIYGMPILNVDSAQQVVVLKRSMNPGFAGIENPLFLNPKTVMLFGDAKESVDKLAASVKGL
jgi:hypothetical protein